MSETQIKTRIKMLFNVLQFSRQKVETLTFGKSTTADKDDVLLSATERILINQQISQLLYNFDYSMAEPQALSEKLEKKIAEIDRLIHEYNWEPLNQIPYGFE